MQRTQVIRFAAFVAVLAVLLGYVVYHRVASPIARPKPLRATQAATGRVTSLENYFVNHRTQRDQMMTREVATIENLLKQPGLSQKSKNVAAVALIRDQTELRQETTIEGLLSARGFPLSLVTVAGGRADVVVGAARLTQAEVAKIADTVTSVTHLPPENVVILPKN